MSDPDLNPIAREAARDMIAILTSSLNNRVPEGTDDQNQLTMQYFNDLRSILEGKNLMEIIAVITQLSGMTCELLELQAERMGLTPQEFLQETALNIG